MKLQKAVTDEASDERVIKLLHFLLTNTIFQDVLKELEINVLYVEEECEQSALTTELTPKCLFLGSGIEEGLRLQRIVDPHVIILNVGGERAVSFVKEARINRGRVVVICEDCDSDSVMELLKLGVKRFVLPPATPQAVMEAVHESLYVLSLEKEMQRQKHMVHSIIEFQNDLLFLVEDDEVTDCNMTFLQFFGCEDLNCYYERYTTFAEAFLEEDEYYTPFNKLTWIDDCVENPQKIKMKDQEGDEHIFLLRAVLLPDEIARYVVMCTNITEMEKINKENERRASTDSLTNIYNRFKFQAMLAKEWEKVRYQSAPLSVILFDIDNFKAVNDTYGHDYGDLALSQLADLVSKHIRQSDIFARWGGEEFVILMPGATGKEAFQAAESLRFFIETKKFSHVSKLTASFGVAEYKRGMTRNKLMKQAGAALSEAKRNGKNQVLLYREGEK